MKKIYISPLIIALTLFGSTAFALSYQEAKQKKFVCENTDGFIKKNSAVLANQTDSIKNDVTKIVADVNQSRTSVYEGVATKNNTSMATASAASALELMRDAPCNCQQDNVKCE